jgi:predicted anti-sigma-YlaC factor YlaD
MKKVLCILIAGAALSGCSIRQAAYNSVSDMLAPTPPSKPPKALPDGRKDPMTALTGENDPQLVKEFFPTALKLYEIMLIQNPEHQGLGIMTGQLYIMYANAFVQTPAEQLPMDQFDKQNDEYRRAQNFYVRGKNYVLGALDCKYPGFSASVFGSDPASSAATLSKCKKNDTPALYWAGAGALGAFSLSPLDTDLLANLGGSLAMLEKAAELDPAFNKGALWEVLMSFYAGAPESLGGGRDKALEAYGKALLYSEGKSPGTHIGYARSFCIPAQDSAGFDEAIEKALAVDPESQAENRLVITIAHSQAQWLKDHKSDFILE